MTGSEPSPIVVQQSGLKAEGQAETRVGFLAVTVIAAEGGCREQNAWCHSDSAWPVRSCVGWVYVYDQGKGRRHRTDSRYSRKDSQRSAASHRGCGGAHWRRCTSRGRQKGIDLAVCASGPPFFTYWNRKKGNTAG